MKGLRIRVRGQVQGVGFRPFVWQLAHRMGLSGRVLNDPEGVLIYVSGAGLDAFEEALRAEAPMLARVDHVEAEAWEGPVEEGFEIVASEGQGAQTRVTPDAATCSACQKEILTLGERRHGYAFANCTHCGPRFTILNGLPYDRERTSMEGFQMCGACRVEYEDPGDRRFHAQPIACPDCGPRLWLEPFASDPIGEAAARLKAGQVVAIKGLGGFHLAVDATNADAVQVLRQRKRRPTKPFALMGTEAMIARYCQVSPQDWDFLRDPAGPIMLLRGAGLPDGIAPGQACLGWMLPYTPLHHLLLAAVKRPLVMTSGNLSGEPQVIDNQEARDKLAAFADVFLMHDRAIVRRLDDSVERTTPYGPMVLRRARGRVPGTLPLPPGFEQARAGVAYGGQMKAALCLVNGGQALLGHHLGELDDALTWEAFQQAEQDYSALFEVRPDWVACDLHPDFRASRHSVARAGALGVPLYEVQHHHAHLAACLGENLWPLDKGPVAGIILDGLGLGPDGTVWGGEVLLGDYRGYERCAWLQPAPLVGGDRAQAEPWRNALVRLDQAGLADWADALFGQAPLEMVRMAAVRGLNAPASSSAGRLFDAVAACLGICPMGQSYEGEAAMRLEALAGDTDHPGYAFGDGLDPAPLFRNVRSDIESGVGLPEISARFHKGLARAFASQAWALVMQGRAQAVALSGGCFQNVRLLTETVQALEGVPVLLHTKTPANDGGLALGQALIAAARVIEGR